MKVANLPRPWKGISSSIKSDFVALVVHDFDEDDTVPAVESLWSAGKNSIAKGVVGAIRTGFEAVGCGPMLVVMVDLSDDLQRVEAILSIYRKEYDVVAGSRYMRGGRIEGGPLVEENALASCRR